jgi:hypothetical protein
VLTSLQIKQLIAIVQKYANVLMYMTTGEGSPSSSLLKKLGIPREMHDVITTFYQYGKLNILEGKSLKNLTIAEVNDLIKTIRLSSPQRQALEFIKLEAGNNISGLSNKITNNITNSVVNNSMKDVLGIREVVGKGVFENKTRAEVASALREYVDDWERDWNRVSHTEMWNAKLHGEIMTILNKESSLSKNGEDTLVFKRPAWNACNQCKKHYLEDDGATPKVFRLSDLLKNGTNVGKKTSDWLPTAGVLHPNCLCPLSILPNGFTFDSDGEFIPINEEEL